MGVRSAVNRVATAFTSPLSPQDYFQVFNPLASARQLRGVVTSVTRHGHRSATIAFRTGKDWEPHLAGQYARIGVEIDGVRQWRSYSLSAAEGDDPAITVTAIGRVSTYLVEHTRRGDLLFLAPPQGDFVLPTGPRPLLMITAGSGITPVMSMLRTLLPRRRDADVVLIHSARTEAESLFTDELRQWEHDHEGFHVVRRLTATDGRIDFADPATLDRLCPDWRSRKAYVCGPAPLLDAAETLWKSAGLPDGLSVERFAAAELVSPDTVGGSVVFGRSDKEISTDGTTTLLELGEEAGVLMPHGCRMGICRSCLIPLISGQVRDLRDGEVRCDEGELIQTCISTPVGPVHLDI
ncbi:ferredoxin reductase [Calidifontibacter terrae]